MYITYIYIFINCIKHLQQQAYGICRRPQHSQTPGQAWGNLFTAVSTWPQIKLKDAGIASQSKACRVQAQAAVTIIESNAGALTVCMCLHLVVWFNAGAVANSAPAPASCKLCHWLSWSPLGPGSRSKRSGAKWICKFRSHRLAGLVCRSKQWSDPWLQQSERFGTGKPSEEKRKLVATAGTNGQGASTINTSRHY